MFTEEKGAGVIIDNAISKYEEHFELDFPLYTEYFFDMVRDDKYDFSIEGAKRLEAHIDKCIKNNKSEEVPEDYYEIDY